MAYVPDTFNHASLWDENLKIYYPWLIIRYILAELKYILLSISRQIYLVENNSLVCKSLWRKLLLHLEAIHAIHVKDRSNLVWPTTPVVSVVDLVANRNKLDDWFDLFVSSSHRLYPLMKRRPRDLSLLSSSLRLNQSISQPYQMWIWTLGILCLMSTAGEL